MVLGARSPAPDTVILIDICKKNYSISDIEENFTTYLKDQECPTCGIVDRMVRHAKYQKYYYAEQIEILRVRCGDCRVTHALIPVFSLPGTSIGTEEAEEYLLARQKGTGRGTAAKGLQEQGLSDRYAKQLDLMFAAAVNRAKALFPQVDATVQDPMSWVTAAVGATDTPLLSLNRHCLAKHFNCLCFCRSSIIIFKPKNAATDASLNYDATGPPAGRIDSS